MAISDVTTRAGGGELALAWIAVGLAVISLPGVLIFVPWGDHATALLLMLSSVSPLSVFLSWVVSIIATLIAGIRLLRRRAGRRSVIALRLAAPVAVLTTAALVAAVYFVAGLLGLTQGNRAADVGHPVTAVYTSQGATMICDNGDGGYGPDNRRPWYEAYFEAPAALGTDALARRALGTTRFPDIRATDPWAGDDDSTRSDGFGLLAGTTHRSAEVDVYPHGGISLFCSTAAIKYGSVFTPSPGHVLIHVRILLPDRG